MNKSRKRALEKAGFTVGSISDFLGLDEIEEELTEFRVSIAVELKKLRSKFGLTQKQLAEKLGTSQSRVAKMEHADPSVSTDLMVQALFRMGAHPRCVMGRSRARPSSQVKPGKLKDVG